MNIEKMNKEKLEYLLFEKELNTVDLLRVQTSLRKYKVDKDIIIYNKELINESIEDLKIDELLKIKKEAIKYKVKTKDIDIAINKIKKGKKPHFTNLFLLGLIHSKKAKDNNQINNDGYYEEEEMDEDDFHYEDLD